ncbi:MAG: sensor histidine kinase [Flavisolibacter sp.]
MERYPFIFSDDRSWRLKRHFAFWFFWWIFQGFLYSFVAFGLRISYFQRLPLSMIESFCFLAPHIFLAYSLMYWVIPRFLLKGRYTIAAITVPLLFVATAFISAIIGVYLLHYVRILVVGKLYIPPLHLYDISIFPALLAGLRGAITIGGIAAAIKLMKYWYTKEQRNLQLQKENAAAQMQILKAQIHPHFLFNTLNSIYAYTQNTSPVASKLLMGLSDMLRYMLYECNQPLVPVDKELKMLKDYINLEQVRYNDELDLNISLPMEARDLFIAPLLLIPFVENSFKHGTSQSLEQPWVSLDISLQEKNFKMKLVNGKASGYNAKSGTGIGISNVRKRLELLYPGRHNLKISNGEDVFVVSLALELQQNKSVKILKTSQEVYE